jgi:hypothetical protein
MEKFRIATMADTEEFEKVPLEDRLTFLTLMIYDLVI